MYVLFICLMFVCKGAGDYILITPRCYAYSVFYLSSHDIFGYIIAGLIRFNPFDRRGLIPGDISFSELYFLGIDI